MRYGGTPKSEHFHESCRMEEVAAELQAVPDCVKETFEKRIQTATTKDRLIAVLKSMAERELNIIGSDNVVWSSQRYVEALETWPGEVILAYNNQFTRKCGLRDSIMRIWQKERVREIERLSLLAS